MRCAKKDCFNCPYPDCINDYVQPLYRRSVEAKERKNATARELYSKRKETHQCVKCGRKLPTGEKRVLCCTCNAKVTEQQRIYKREKGITPKELMDGENLCSRCGKSPPADGHKQCARCLEISRKAYAKACAAAGRKRRAEQMEQLIKSRQRVRDHGEVFTPAWLVKQMCDLLPPEMWEPQRTFLEPACGTGNFLVEILSRKLDRCQTREDALIALGSIYGIDILPDNVEDSRQRMKKIWAAQWPMGEDVEAILERNVICADALQKMEEMAKEDERK